MTGTDNNADTGTSSEHAVEVTANGQVRDVAICGPGKRCSAGSADYFTLDIERFGFSTSCVRKEDIEALKLKEGGTGLYNQFLFFLIHVKHMSLLVQMLTSISGFRKVLVIQEGVWWISHLFCNKFKDS